MRSFSRPTSEDFFLLKDWFSFDIKLIRHHFAREKLIGTPILHSEAKGASLVHGFAILDQYLAK
jgi:hypothetical protein